MANAWPILTSISFNPYSNRSANYRKQMNIVLQVLNVLLR